MSEKILFTWSGGKDSAFALYELQKTKDYEVMALLTTVTEDYNRISMHGVQAGLLEQQAEFMGFTLEKVYITKNSSNEEYEAKMREKLISYQKLGVSSVVFGDIFLEEIRKYREENLSKIGMKGIFPIWKRDTAELAHAFIDIGFKAVTTCVDTKFLDKSFVGRIFDRKFLSELPSGVDPCGENGEFHSFVYDGPIFQKEIAYKKGEVVLRDSRFYYCDLIPLQHAPVGHP
ncbi:MAG: diphthine--ammonia ligase [Candidatus Omnitrophica bacterium]|nr:diphthine--ammonia ligase [Candidatus Omnitrophota bacterium]